jgi:hypothetical protein
VLAGFREPGELTRRPGVVVGFETFGVLIGYVAQLVSTGRELPDEDLAELAPFGGLAHPEGEGFAGLAREVGRCVLGA